MAENYNPDEGFLPLESQFEKYLIGKPKFAKGFRKIDIEALMRQKEEREKNERSERLQSDTLELLTGLSLGVSPNDLKLHRYVPIEFQINASVEQLTEEQPFAELLQFLLSRFLNAFGFELDAALEFEYGSIHWRPHFYTRDRMTHADLEDRLQLIEHTISVFLTLSASKEQAETEPDEVRKRAELAQLNAEARKANAETVKVYLEAAQKLVSLILSVSIGVSIALGTIRIEKVNVTPDKQEIKMHRVTPEKALTDHSAPIKNEQENPISIEVPDENEEAP